MNNELENPVKKTEKEWRKVNAPCLVKITLKQYAIARKM